MYIKSPAVFAAAILLTGLLSSCAGSSNFAAATDTTTPTPTKSKPPASGGTFGTITELRDAAVEGGEVCPTWDEHNRVTLASSSASCNDSLVMAIYASESSKDKQLAVWKEFGSMVEMSVLVGENWTVSTKNAASLQKVMGGTVFKTPGKE
ncbi:hypothetical protein [Paenarthrobacter nitroguajacolicus]